MKVKCPKNVCSVSIGGEEFTVDRKGCITLPDEGSYMQLLPEGFEVVDSTRDAPAGDNPGPDASAGNAGAAQSGADTEGAQGAATE